MDIYARDKDKFASEEAYKGTLHNIDPIPDIF